MLSKWNSYNTGLTRNEQIEHLLHPKLTTRANSF